MTSRKQKFLSHALWPSLLVLIFAGSVRADEPAFTAIGEHLKSHYHATERHIPFMGLAYFAVKVVRPAGVKNFRIKIYEHLNYSYVGIDEGLNGALEGSLGNGWSSVVRVYSRKDHSQTLVYAKDEGNSIRVMVVNLSDGNAVVVRMKVDVNKLSKFIDNPKILGISLGDNDH